MTAPPSTPDPSTNPPAPFDRVTEAVHRLVTAIRDDQWHGPTPCAEWDVRAVLGHLVAGDIRFTALVRGQALPHSDADPLDGDPAAGYRRTTEALRVAFARPGVLDQTYQSPLGLASGAVLLSMRISEHLVHGWDLARATGQPAELPADLAEQALTSWRRIAAAGRDGLPIQEEQPVADNAAAIDRLAAFLGRTA